MYHLLINLLLKSQETVWKEHKLMKKLQLSLMESKMFQI